MEITTQQFKRCDLVKASGRIDAYTASELEEAFAAIMEAGRFRIVFDMSEVNFISSVGLRVLIDAQRACKRFNRGEMVLASVSDQIARTLELAGFYTYFETYDTPLDAVGSF